MSLLLVEKTLLPDITERLESLLKLQIQRVSYEKYLRAVHIAGGINAFAACRDSIAA